MRRFITILFLPLLLYGWSCKPYAKYYRKYSNEIFGIRYPYQLFLAQGAVESKCKLNAISNDGVGSRGIGQITWRWWKDYLRKNDVPNLATIDNQVKAQLFIMKHYYIKFYFNNKYRIKCGKQHYIPYQMYNGGALVLKEIDKAPNCNHKIVRNYCRRKIIRFKNGSTRSACDINYKYPITVLKFATKYYNYVPSKYEKWKMFK